jgi:sialate O-acetylesterase
LAFRSAFAIPFAIVISSSSEHPWFFAPRVLYVAALLALLPLCRSACAEIRLPHLFTDHAVLQRDRPLRVWGWAAPGANLTVHFHAQTLQAAADTFGAWSVTLQPETSGGPYVLTVDGDGHAEVKDILMGDVWIASGQSNMEIPLKGFGPNTPIKNGAAEIAAAHHPEIRLLLEGRKSADIPQDDVEGTWELCTPTSAAEFSAVAYFFGKEISAREHVAIGLVDATWGGTPADAWVSLDTLGTDANLLPAFRARAQFAEQQGVAEQQQAIEKREDAAAAAAGRFATHHPWHPFEASWIPAALYNGMIAPLTPYSVAGFLWYQGETNSGPERADFYATLFPALIGDWRMHFAQGDLPFLFVQISAANAPGEHWGMVRDAQRRALVVRNTAMAVSLDVGSPDNVHPPDKQTVSARLALAARALVYGENVAYIPPQPREVTAYSAQPGALQVWFDHADGLTARGQGVNGFEVAGADQQFVPATARIEGTTVIVAATQVTQPKYVRYLWQNFPPAPLYNREGLPASTFSSEWFPTIER